MTVLKPQFLACSRSSGRSPRACSIALLLLLLSTGVAMAAESDIRGPDVTIIAGEDKTIHEYRQGGQLRMVKIIPKWGKPYYLVPADNTEGYGDLERAKTLIPSWVIVEF
jgi:hypothetical protein